MLSRTESNFISFKFEIKMFTVCKAGTAPANVKANLSATGGVVESG